jgi:hypothetical protein
VCTTVLTIDLYNDDGDLEITKQQKINVFHLFMYNGKKFSQKRFF